MSAVAKRYARAAVGAARDAGGAAAVDEMATSMAAFKDAVRESAELREVMANPSLENARSRAIVAVGKKLEATDLATRVVLLLCDKERIAELSDIADEIRAIADEQAGRLRAAVVSAISLTAKQQTRIEKALQKRFGRPVVVDVEIDSSIVAGLIVRVGDFTIDSSVKRQLEIVSERLHLS